MDRIAIRIVLSIALLAAGVLSANGFTGDEYKMLLRHAPEPANDKYECMTEKAVESLKWFEEDYALAEVAIDSLNADYRRANHNSKSEGIYSTIASVEARKKRDLLFIDELKSLKHCPQPPGTPPPVPHPQAFPGGVIGEPSTRVPTHRQTNCAYCKPTAAKLNDLIDELSDAVTRKGPKSEIYSLQMEIRKYSTALDGCERICHSGTTQDQDRAPPKPPHQPPHEPKGVITEDDPRYMENYSPPTNKNPPSPHHNSNHSNQRPPGMPPDAPGEQEGPAPNTPYDKMPDSPMEMPPHGP